jgi:hypothetical protein
MVVVVAAAVAEAVAAEAVAAVVAEAVAVVAAEVAVLVVDDAEFVAAGHVFGWGDATRKEL